MKPEEADIEQLPAEVDSLTEFADRLSNHPTTQERIAREWYGMLRDGETIVRVVRP